MNLLTNQSEETNFQNTCQFCHEPTNRIYKNLSNNKVSCCESCSQLKANQSLTISLILTGQSYQKFNYEPIPDVPSVKLGIEELEA